VQPSTRNHYLETEVMTASPQKLQCMLIEAAIRNLQRAKHFRGEGDHEQACEAMIRAQEIITQILSGLNHEIGGDLTRKVASIYMFLFRTINEAQRSEDDVKIDECLGVLEIERDTWRLLCEKLDQEQSTENASATATLSGGGEVAASESPYPSAPAMPPLDLSSDFGGADGATSGFSIEA
jgi:flagellar protein FliS